MIATLTGIVADHGSIVVFEGKTAKGQTVTVGVDHRMASDLADLIFADGEVRASFEPWQVLGVGV